MKHMYNVTTKNRSEAIAMSIFEYDEEKHMKSEREQLYQEHNL